MLLVCPPVFAAPTAYGLDYRAPAECPDDQAFVRRIAQRTKNAVYRGDARDPRFAIRVERAGAEWKGEVVLRASETARQVSGATCDSVADALALIVSVSLDPALVLALTTEQPKPPDRSVPVAKPPEQTARAEPPADAPSRIAVTLGAGAFAASGPAPEATLGAYAFGEVAGDGGPGPSLRLVVSRATTGVIDVGSGAARFVLSTARLEGCAPRFGAGDFGVTGCLTAEGGSVHAEGFARGQVSEPASATRLWLEAGIISRASWRFADPLGIELWGGVGAPFTRRAYVFENPREVVHEPPLFVGRAGLGLMATLP